MTVLIESHNAKKSSFTLAHNEYSDLTTDEFHQRMKIGKYSPDIIIDENKKFNFMEFNQEDDESTVSAAADNSLLRGGAADNASMEATERRRLDLAASKSLFPHVDKELDWGTKGLLGPIRNQGPCGACWAFSTIGSVEAAMAIEKFKSLPSPLDPTNLGLVTPLSEQELIDCDTRFEHGCVGGLMITTFNEEEHRRGLCTEADYPYTESQGKCAQSSCTPITGSIVKNHVDILPRQTKLLKEALKVKPVTAAMDASDPMFQFYSKGIFQSPTCGVVTKEIGDKNCELLYENQDVCLPNINHGVLVVGYGYDEKAEGVKEFLKVKNSWGDSWGEGGFFRLSRSDIDNPDPKKNWGECAILSMLSYPVME
jgi:C1A family cysteine protease